MKQWIPHHDGTSECTPTTNLSLSLSFSLNPLHLTPKQRYIDDPTDTVYRNIGARKEVEVEAMTTGQLSALAAKVAEELKRRGGRALGVGERKEVRGAALGLFAVCGGGDGAS